MRHGRGARFQSDDRLKEALKASWSPLKTGRQKQLGLFVRRPLDDVDSPERRNDLESSLDVSPRDQTVYAVGYPSLFLASLNLRTGTLEVDTGLASTMNESMLSNIRPSSVAFVGQSQLWIGTERGTLHVIEKPLVIGGASESRMHEFERLKHAVLCINAGPIARKNRRVYAGKSNGELVIFTGDVALHGGLVNPFASSSVVNLTEWNKPGPPLPVRCMAFADDGKLWCGVGTYIVIFDPDTLEIEDCVKAEQPKNLPSGGRVPEGGTETSSHGRRLVTHLVPSNVGMWSACRNASSVFLWDTKTYAVKTEIVSRAFRASAGWVETSADISALAVDRVASILLLGTRGGHTLLFDILPTNTVSAFRPRFLVAQHHDADGAEQIRSLVPLTQPPIGTSDVERELSPPSAAAAALSFRYVSCAEGDIETGSVVHLWDLEMPHDRDRLKRVLFYQHVNDSRNSSKSFAFPDLELVHVAPTALVSTPL